MEILDKYLIPVITLFAGFFFARGKNAADARKSHSEAEKNTATTYKEAAEYWEKRFDKCSMEKDALIEKQLKEQQEKEIYLRKIDELERKIDILTSQVKQFTLKYNEQQK